MWYDVLVVMILFYAVIRGAVKGIVWQLATIAALVLCFGFSETLSMAIAPYITLQPPLNRWVAMFGLYLGFSFLSFAVARALKKWIEKAEFVEYDRHLGSVFGLIKGGIFVLVMTFFGVTLTQQMPQARETIFNSYTGRISAVVLDRLHPVMPTELHEVLEPYIHSLDRPGLELHAHKHDDDDDDHEDEHGANHFHPGETPPPLEAPPFPEAPRRTEEPPPFGDIIGRETERPNIPSLPDPNEFFELPFSVPKLPEFYPERPTNEAGNGAANLRAEREKMLSEVASVLANSEDGQRAIINEIEKSLAGLPDEIKLGVVKDWYTDLLAFDPNADPDPETDLSTSFDERILRQLKLKNVPLSSLSAALRDRLRQ